MPKELTKLCLPMNFCILRGMLQWTFDLSQCYFSVREAKKQMSSLAFGLYYFDLTVFGVYLRWWRDEKECLWQVTRFKALECKYTEKVHCKGASGIVWVSEYQREREREREREKQKGGRRWRMEYLCQADHRSLANLNPCDIHAFLL